MGDRRGEEGQTTVEWMVLSAAGFGAGSVAWNLAVGAVLLALLPAVLGLVTRAAPTPVRVRAGRRRRW